MGPGRRKKTVADDGNVRLFLNVGKDNGISMNSFIKEFAKQTGVREDKIKNVSLKDQFSFFEIPKQHGEDVLKKNISLNKQDVRLEYSD